MVEPSSRLAFVARRFGLLSCSPAGLTALRCLDLNAADLQPARPGQSLQLELDRLELVAIQVPADRHCNDTAVSSPATWLPFSSLLSWLLRLFRRDPFAQPWSLSISSQNPSLRPEIHEATPAPPRFWV